MGARKNALLASASKCFYPVLHANGVQCPARACGCSRGKESPRRLQCQTFGDEPCPAGPRAIWVPLKLFDPSCVDRSLPNRPWHWFVHIEIHAFDLAQASCLRIQDGPWHLEFLALLPHQLPAVERLWFFTLHRWDRRIATPIFRLKSGHRTSTQSLDVINFFLDTPMLLQFPIIPAGPCVDDDDDDDDNDGCRCSSPAATSICIPSSLSWSWLSSSLALMFASSLSSWGVIGTACFVAPLGVWASALGLSKVA